VSDTVIRVENLGKKYVINHQSQSQGSYKSLRESISNGAKSLVKNFLKVSESETSNSNREDFWALNNVSFEIKQGERIGIVGRNGAGKSTLLKILSRITEPTTGRINIKGRIASLLEVGTGFHPELTGRENIYLNGAILGMSQAEIQRKFDEIVAFAEVEKFLDTPVKRYSSGMYVRLAFAVAAHLEPEILIVDEVLAVGDSVFQKKCLGKMEDVSAKEGRSVIFVSHNISAVRKVCTTGIFLDSGYIKLAAEINQVIRSYTARYEEVQPSYLDLDIAEDKPQIKSICLPQSKLNYGDCISIELELASPFTVDAAIELEIHDERGLPIIYTSTAPMAGRLLKIIGQQINKFNVHLGPLNLAQGDYYIYFWLIKPWVENYHIVRQPLKFSVEFSDPFESGFEFRQSYARGATTVPIHVSN
jgi:lipopolysaccharide transport system ATP-binding protein